MVVVTYCVHWGFFATQGSRMAFLKSWKFAVGVVIVLSVLAVAGVLYGVSTHTEAGLMQVTPEWVVDDFPLTVCPSSYVEPQEAAVLAVHNAVGTTNTRLGFKAFEIDCQGTPAVTVLVGVSAERGQMNEGGVADIRPRSCAVQTANTGTAELLDLVLQHELGHCLGLAHDDFESSIMRPRQSPTPDMAFPPSITDSDKALLVRLYGPRHEN